MSTAATRDLLRHLLATIAYRAGKVIRGAPAEFGAFLPPGAMNTPLMLISHIADLLEWADRWSRAGDQKFHTAEPSSWDGDVARFYSALQRLDAHLASDAPLNASIPVLLQAPIADMLTHIGQLALLRRMAGAPVLGEAYRVAPIAVGRVGPDQEPPGREFPLNKGAIWLAPSEPRSE
jgi:hypothetical protein